MFPQLALVTAPRERCVMMAEVCLRAQRHEDMAKHVEQLARGNTDLSEQEEKLFCTAFNHVIG